MVNWKVPGGDSRCLRAGEQRQPSPQRVRSDRVRGVLRAVKEQIRLAEPPQVLRLRQFPSENDPDRGRTAAAASVPC
eukprot:COSAG03_NODE_1968_length_3280_cov_21.156869_2_plen_77_part_00